MKAALVGIGWGTLPIRKERRGGGKLEKKALKEGKKARSREPIFAGLYLVPYPECLS